MHIALYKGPATDWAHKIAHWAVCLFTGSPYSHCELVIGGICYTSSARDGGVRFKRIALGEKWTLDATPTCPRQAAQWARDNEGRLYDWQLILGFLAWAVPHKRSRVMCSEACADMLGLVDAWRFDPCVLRAVVAPWRRKGGQ